MIEALAHAGIPTIPVRVWHDGDKWRKRPLADKWDEATTDCEVLARWSRQWPEALPGVPLERVGWVAIDVDADDAAFWEVWEGLGPRGPYSKIQTVSVGWHFVFAQPPEQITRFKWTEGVEILGTASVLTVYDVEEILFPKVAPRAILPEVFRKPYARSHVCPIKKREAATAPQRDGLTLMLPTPPLRCGSWTRAIGAATTTAGSILLVRARRWASAAESSCGGAGAIRYTPLMGAQLRGFGTAQSAHMAGHCGRH